jgi:uncharacterized protein (TIGR00297 family)
VPRLQGWRKAIPESRDRLQSRVLVWLVGLPMAAASATFLVLALFLGVRFSSFVLQAGSIALTFGVVVWALRAATPTAAALGASICLPLILDTSSLNRSPALYSGLTPLFLLFLLTFAAGRVGRRQKARAVRTVLVDPEEAREARRGRSAAQILANLGTAGVIAFADLGLSATHDTWRAMLLAALAEATADTLSSELGSAFGGAPFLLTTLRRVEAGTDGAISLFGTFSGVAGATLVVCAGWWALRLSLHGAEVALIGGLAGLFFESLLGATVERRGWLGNDWVNFLSTVFASLVAFACLAVGS